MCCSECHTISPMEIEGQPITNHPASHLLKSIIRFQLEILEADGSVVSIEVDMTVIHIYYEEQTTEYGALRDPILDPFTF